MTNKRQSKLNELIPSFYPENIGTCLDYGCNNGKFVEHLLSARKAEELFGVDVSDEKIAQAREKELSAKFLLIEPSKRLDFTDEHFDIVSMYQVLEHVGDERFVLDELTRILKPGGTLVISVPNKGLFTWADTNNFRFNFPTLH